MQAAHIEWKELPSLQPVSTPPQSKQRLVVFGHSIDDTLLGKLVTSLIGENIPVTHVTLFKPHDFLETAASLSLNIHPSNLTQAFKARVRAIFAEHDLEAAIIENAPSLQSPGLLLMDMDSTAIQIECIDEIARLAGVYDEVAAVTQAAMAGQLAFSDSLVQRVAKLQGIEMSLLDTIRFDLPLMPGIEQLCSVLKANDWKLAIASGGFTLFAEQLRKSLQLDEIVANELAFDGTALNGKVIGRIIDAKAKQETLCELAARYDIPSTQTVAIGDGANDLMMMAEAQLGVAIHGKEKVVYEADAAICHGSLLQLVYFLSAP